MTDPSPTEPYAPPPRGAAPPPNLDDAPRPPATAARAAIAERRGPGGADLLFGLLFLGVGLWLLADVSLGLDLPRVRWGDLWPVLLIVLGGWVLLGAARRR